MKSIYLIKIILVTLLIDLQDHVTSAKPMPGSLRKVASNNINGLFRVAKAYKRGHEEDALNTNQIPTMDHEIDGDDNYYDDLMEPICPHGFILFLKNGDCVPEKCGVGTIRNRITGDCMEDDNMANAIQVMDNVEAPIGHRFSRARGRFFARTNPSKLLRRLGLARHYRAARSFPDF